MKNGSANDVDKVSGEIELLRGELGSLVTELDRRRREMLDFKLQARRHPVFVAVAAGTAALLIGSVIALAVRDRRRQSRPSIRAREARRALARLLDHPRRVAAEPSVAARIATAAGVAAGTAIARHLAQRAVARAH